MKIYQSFKVDGKALPLTYNSENIQLIIKSLSHEVSPDGWLTKVETIAGPIFNVTPALNTGTYSESGLVEVVPQSTANAASSVNAIPGIDPAPSINPQKIGSSSPENTPVFRATGINLRRVSKEGVLQLVKQGKLILVGDYKKDPQHFVAPNKNLVSVQLLDGKYYLEKKAGEQFLKWTNELKSKNIPFSISSAVRFGRNVGGGAHGYGVAVDFNNLFQLVNGSENPTTNLNARKKSKIYEQIALIGTKYGWYNPWRLSDVKGQDEIWHFEYWGSA